MKFKKHNVNLSKDARCYIYILDNCVKCDATITCTLLKVPSDRIDIIFSCEIKNICSSKHDKNAKKRHLRGNRRAVTADIMIEQRKDAISFRREEGKRLKDFGDNSPPILPSSTVLRKAKEERLLNKYGLMFSNPLLNLQHLAMYGKYSGSIICISLLHILPLYCIYWTPEQQLLYRARCKEM